MPVGFTPIYRIIKGDLDVTDRFNTQTTQIQVELNSGGGMNDTFKITVDDRDWQIVRPDVGATLQIHLGYKELGMSFMGLFEINDVTFHGPPRAITLTGLSAGMMGVMKSPSIREFENKTVGEILSDIGAKSGISVKVDPKLANKTIAFKNQIGVSNFHLIHELERQFGAMAKMWNGQLIFTARDEGQDMQGMNFTRRVLRPEHFGQWSVKHTTRAEYSSVKVPYWDKLTNTTKWVEEVWKGINPEGFGGTDSPFRVNRKFNNEEEAKEFARSRLAALKRSAGEAQIELAKGDPWIMPQMPVIISGMRDGIDGSYIVDSVSHTYTMDAGIMTQMLCKNPGAELGAGVNIDDELPERDIQYLRPAIGERMGDYIVGVTPIPGPR